MGSAISILKTIKMEKNTNIIDSTLLLLCAREYDENSLWHKDYLPLDMLKVIRKQMDIIGISRKIGKHTNTVNVLTVLNNKLYSGSNDTIREWK